MGITYFTNFVITTKSVTEWHFGKEFVKNATDEAKLLHEVNKQREFKYWQPGTGYMTIKINQGRKSS